MKSVERERWLKFIFRASFKALVLCAFLSGDIHASGYEFDGVGALEVLRGGASIADSRGWPSVYWNPANLVFTESNEIGIEARGGAMMVRDPNSFNVGAANPFRRKRVYYPVLSGSLGGVFSFGGEYAFGWGAYVPVAQGSDFSDVSDDPVYRSLDYEGFALIETNNVSVAKKLTDRLSAGAGVNILYGKIKTDSTLLFSAGSSKKDNMNGDGWGVEGIFGLNYTFSGKVRGGLVFRTGGKVRIKGEAGSVMTPLEENSGFHFTLNHPPTSGIGFSYEAGDSTLFSADFTQTWWKGFSNRITYDTQGILINDQANTFAWKNSWKIRFGLIKKLSRGNSLVCGYAFDTPAIDKDSIDLSTAVDVPMHRLSLGFNKKFRSSDLTLGFFGGYSQRSENGLKYKLGGWYLISQYNIIL